jgi:hypothetical protein
MWAMGYNVLMIPLAAGALYPAFKFQMPPWVAGFCMAFSSVSVVMSSLALRRYRRPPLPPVLGEIAVTSHGTVSSAGVTSVGATAAPNPKLPVSTVTVSDHTINLGLLPGRGYGASAAAAGSAPGTAKWSASSPAAGEIQGVDYGDEEEEEEAGHHAAGSAGEKRKGGAAAAAARLLGPLKGPSKREREEREALLAKLK